MHVQNNDHQKGVQQLIDSRAQYFVICWILKIYFLKLFFFYFANFFRKHITLSCKRDMRTLLRPIHNSIQNYGWRQDCLVDPIEIGFTISQTLWSRTCGRPKVFQLLDTCNQFWALKLWSLRRFKTNELKLGWPILLLRQNDLMLRWLNSGDCTWNWNHRWVVHVPPNWPHDPDNYLSPTPALLF